MQKPACHSHGQHFHGHRWNRCRRPERWNCGWSNGTAPQMHQKCHQESTGTNDGARDMMDKKNDTNHRHSHHHGHFHSHQHLHSHSHGHGHFHPHPHHHHGHCYHGTPNQPRNMPHPCHSCSCHANQHKTCNTSTPAEAEVNTRSVGTETENEASQHSA